jgi:ATP-binding cassette, sub-family E, member 1
VECLPSLSVPSSVAHKQNYNFFCDSLLFISHSHSKKTAFIVEHDFIMATYLADRVVVYEGNPGIECTATAPRGLLVGMNSFLEHLGITFRRDPTNYRPRINKLDSQKDREQKASGQYFFLDE